jgi:hypothetical protein
MFKRGDGWEEVGAFCAYSCQNRRLRLKPWMVTPSWLTTDADVQAALAMHATITRAVGLAANWRGGC